MVKAISVKQPWAGLIAQGLKTIEVRTWQTDYLGPLLIVSSLTEADWYPERDYSDKIYYLAGRAICLVDLVKITRMRKEHEAAALCDSAPGLFAWHLKNIRLVEPVQIKGRLRLFDINLKIIEK